MQQRFNKFFLFLLLAGYCYAEPEWQTCRYVTQGEIRCQGNTTTFKNVTVCVRTDRGINIRVTQIEPELNKPLLFIQNNQSTITDSLFPTSGLIRKTIIKDEILDSAALLDSTGLVVGILSTRLSKIPLNTEAIPLPASTAYESVDKTIQILLHYTAYRLNEPVPPATFILSNDE